MNKNITQKEQGPVDVLAFPELAHTGATHYADRRRTVVSVMGVLWIATAAVAVASFLGHPLALGPLSAGGHAIIGWRMDRVAALAALLVATVGLTATSYASRYLASDGPTNVFAVLPWLVVAGVVMAGATTAVTLALGWSLSGGAAVLLAHPKHPLSSPMGRAFLVGDAALWIAVAIVLGTWGDFNLQHGLTHHHTASTATMVVLAVLLATAVTARCALLPALRWLPATLSAPTPVSAVLHAGIVNAGGIVLIRLAPVVGHSAIVQTPLVLLGGATVVAATASMLTEPTVKGTLVRSTSAQMGFMIVCCGLGWYTAALLHLVAHGLYKATLFFGSGGAIEAYAASRRYPPRLPGQHLFTTLAAIALPLAGLIATVTVLAPSSGRLQLIGIVGFGAATAIRMATGWARRLRSALAASVVIAALTLAICGYVLLAHLAVRFVAASIPATSTLLLPGLCAIATVLGLVALAALVHWPSLSATSIGRRLFIASAQVGRSRRPATHRMPGRLRSTSVVHPPSARTLEVAA